MKLPSQHDVRFEGEHIDCGILNYGKINNLRMKNVTAGGIQLAAFVKVNRQMTFGVWTLV